MLTSDYSFIIVLALYVFFFFKQKTAYEMRISDWSSDVCSSDLTKAHPDLVVWKMAKDLRPGKIFLDWSQNVAAKTTICPYSLRGREAPTVAAPRGDRKSVV